MKRGARRLLLSVPLAVVVLLAAEGALSLAGQHGPLRLLAERLGGPRLPPPPTLSDSFRQRAAADVEGLNRLHPDPLVGCTLRTNAELAIHDGTIRSAHLGLRRPLFGGLAQQLQPRSQGAIHRR